MQKSIRQCLFILVLLSSLVACSTSAETISANNIKQVRQLARWNSGALNRIIWSPDGNQLVIASATGIHFYDAQAFQQVQFIDTNDEEVDDIAFSLDGKLLAWSLPNGTVKLWEVSTNRELHTFVGHIFGVISLAFSPDGKLLASGSLDDTVRIWEVSGGSEQHTFTHVWDVICIAFSPDGKLLAVGSEQTVTLLEIGTGHELYALHHTRPVHSVAFSPDGKLLASGSGGVQTTPDNLVKLWDVTNGRELLALTGHTSWVHSVAFSPDGKLLVAGSWERIIVWEMPGGEELRNFTEHSSTGVAFSPNGNLLVSGLEDGTVRLWGTAWP